MNKTTPGPWVVEEYGDDDAPALVIHKDSETRVCFMAPPGSHGDPAKIEADAHLIASAPDLLKSAILALEAIDAILPAHVGQSEYAQLKAAFDALETAIAKTEDRHA